MPIDFETVLTLRNANVGTISTDLLAAYVMDEIRKQFDGIKETNLSEHLAKSPRRYIFIFDNLDLAYAEFCKHFVKGDQDVQGVIGATNYLACLKHLVHVFQEVSRPTSLATPAVLFCLRDDTFFLLDKVTENIGQPGLKEQHNLYSLGAPLPDAATVQFASIVRKRGKLIQTFLSDAGEQDLAVSVAGWFSGLPASDSKAFRRYVNLSVQGMRTAIHSLNKYASLASAPSAKVFSALTDEYRSEVLGYFNGQEFYSQNESNIANIFLVNTEYRNSSETAVVPSGLTVSPFFHQHTYWLKYLIFSFIAASSDYGKKATLFEEIRRIFSDIGGYPKDLVSLVVYSLTEIEHGRLVRPISKENSRLVTLTSRGTEFAGGSMGVAWSAGYLSTVVEDEWMELPVSLHQKTRLFGINAFWNDPSYCQYLIEKAEVVREFLIVLEMTLAFEQESRAELFEELGAVTGFSDLMPNFKAAQKQLLDEFALAGEVLGDERRHLIRSKIEELGDPGKTHKRIEELRAELTPLYDYRVR